MAGPALVAHQWWRDEAKDAHQMAYTYVQAVEEAQASLRQRQYRNAYLYTGEPPIGNWRVRWKVAPSWMQPQTEARQALIETVADTATAMIGATLGRVSFQTDGAEWSERRRAVHLERWTEAEWKRLRLNYLRTLKFRDALWAEIGVLYWDDDGKQVRVRHLSPFDVIVDERSCGSFGFTQFHFVETKDKDEALAEFDNDKDAKKAIEKATGRWVSFMNVSAESVLVFRSWKPARRRRDGELIPGRMMTYTDGGIIDRKEWKRAVPVSAYRWKEPLSPGGFHGRSLTDQLAWDEARLNKMLRFKAYCQDLMAAPKWLKKASEGDLVINNEPGQVVEYTQTPPQPLTPPVLGADFYADVERSYRQSFEKVGFSQLSATLKTPSADFATGPAFREYRDYEMGRFQSNVIRFEEDMIEDSRQMVAAQRDLVERGGVGEATWRSKNLARKIRFADIDLDEDRYVLSLEPASNLSRTPAGREARAAELVRAGLLDRSMALRMSGHPDAQRQVDLLDAPFDLAEMTLEDLLDGKWKPPDRSHDLELSIKIVHLGMIKAGNEGAPDVPILEGGRRWIKMAEWLQKRMQAEQPAPAGSIPGNQGAPAPGGPPLLPPQQGGMTSAA